MLLCICDHEIACSYECHTAHCICDQGAVCYETPCICGYGVVYSQACNVAPVCDNRTLISHTQLHVNIKVYNKDKKLISDMTSSLLELGSYYKGLAA